MSNAQERLQEIGATMLRAPFTCSCSCRCGIRHTVEGKCPWCSKGDCWWSLDRYLAKIEAWQAS